MRGFFLDVGKPVAACQADWLSGAGAGGWRFGSGDTRHRNRDFSCAGTRPGFDQVDPGGFRRRELVPR